MRGVSVFAEGLCLNIAAAEEQLSLISPCETMFAYSKIIRGRVIIIIIATFILSELRKCVLQSHSSYCLSMHNWKKIDLKSEL